MTGFRAPDTFRRLGLSTNPFNHREHTDIAARFDAPSWIQALADERWDGLLIVGASGVGKTTAAHMLTQRLRERSAARVHWIRLGTDGAAWPDAPKDIDIFVVDSVQRLGRMARWRLGPALKRSPRTILVGQEDVTLGRIPSGYEMRVTTPPPPTAQEVRATYEAYVTDAALTREARAHLQPSAERVRQLLDAGASNRLRLHRLLYQCFELWADGRGQWPDDDLLVPRAARIIDDEDVSQGPE